MSLREDGCEVDFAGNIVCSFDRAFFECSATSHGCDSLLLQKANLSHYQDTDDDHKSSQDA